ncbi:hypothetical protein [Desulfosarcina ovata]|uniref:Uncharacterized protein n=1 Tax=Desulfosarcina ovata subsp. ovata TaxID=2752305 RepID=A0A5K8A3A2_9BACT|nr:hypothetical protein [Desulfosarcina ovata]BBO87043.1 hypothetical protein DSCOOX_02230 [Desulfosarcina ovata subsp. ovata]
MDKELIEIIGEVAGEPLSLVAYLAIIALFSWRAWLNTKPVKEAEKILDKYKNDIDRNKALEHLIGNSIPDKIGEEKIIEWVKLKSKEKTRKMLVLAYIATLVTILSISAFAYDKHKRQKSNLELIEITNE